jgi:hypothetical protein
MARKRKAAKRKSAGYPRETAGSRIAAKVRRRTNSLTEEKREEHFHAGMAMIYGPCY